jgi:RND family efflux transporter MFP subunit
LACRAETQIKPPVLPTVRVSVDAGSSSSGALRIAASVQSTQRAEIASRLSASVRSVVVHEGQRVRRGALLLTLGADDLQQRIAAARVALETAQAQQRRMADLMSQGIVAQRDRDLAEAQVAAAQAELSSAVVQLSYAEVRAPFDGIVQRRYVDAGSLASPGMPLVLLESEQALELVAAVSALEAQQLALGTRVSFETDDGAGTAEVSALASVADPLTHRRWLRARVTKAPESLAAGGFARMLVPRISDSSQPSVPASALITRGELTGVFVVDDGRAMVRWIAIGERIGDRVLVRAGLTPQDTVIVSPSTVRDGQPVEVVP